MNERPSIPTDHTDLAQNHIGAVAFNAVLEAMYVLHRRARFSGSDFRRAEVVRKALLDLPCPSVEEQTDANIGQNEDAGPTPLLEALERALNDAKPMVDA